MSYKKTMFLAVLIYFLFVSTVKADALDTMETNLNMEISDVIMIVLSCAIIVIGALDARIAIMCAFLLYTSVFILFTLATEEGIAGFNPYYSGVAMMMCFVIVCLMLLISYKKSNTPYNVV